MDRIAAICWGFCHMAHDASADEIHFPGWMRATFGAFGAAWYWLAMTAQGDFHTVWSDHQQERKYKRAEQMKLSSAAVA